MNKETRVVDVELELRAEDGKPTRLVGYAARFNEPSLPLAGGRFVEVIQPGAFRTALSKKDSVPLLIEHDGLALADTATGTLKISEDSRGLRFEAELDPADPDAQRVIPKLSRGTLRKMSFTFQVAEGGADWNHTQRPAKRTVTDIDYLADLSLVTRPAYPSTDVALRSLEEAEKREAPPAPPEPPKAEAAPDIPAAIKALRAAIVLHEKHMDGSAPTTGPDGETSQMAMMQMMKDALASLTGGEAPNKDGAMQMRDVPNFNAERERLLLAEIEQDIA